MTTVSREIAARQTSLQALALAAFPDLSTPEKMVLRAVCTPTVAYPGQEADVASCPASCDDDQRLLEWMKGRPTSFPQSSEGNGHAAAKWGEDRNVRGELIRWLSIDGKAKALMDPKGIQLFGARIIGKLDLGYVDVPFRISLKRCRIQNPCFFTSSQIPELDLEGSWTGPLNADGIQIKHNLNLRYGFCSNGTVRLVGAKIDGSLGCGESSFFGHDDAAINADLITVGGAVFFRGGKSFDKNKVTPFHAEGPVRLLRAKVGSDVDCSGGEFISPSSDPDNAALNLEGAEVKGTLILRPMLQKRFHASDVVNLRATSVGTFQDDMQDWPKEFKLDGFVYKEIAKPSDTEKPAARTMGDRGLAWLGRDTLHPTQSYRQLAKILQEAGDAAGAKHVLIEMERIIAKGDLPPIRQVKGLIGYGYEPMNAVYGLAGVTVLGWILYRRSLLSIVPSDDEAAANQRCGHPLPANYPRFSPFFYSLENTFPLVTLGQCAKWQADPAPKSGKRLPSIRRLGRWITSPRFIGVFMWVQILLGWLLATLFLSAVSGIVQHS